MSLPSLSILTLMIYVATATAHGDGKGHPGSCGSDLTSAPLDLVTVYRGVILDRAADLDIAYNYAPIGRSFEADYVSTDFRVAAIYMKGPEARLNKTAFMMVYRIPRELLEPKGNGMYMVPSERLKRSGLSSPSTFLERIALVHAELPKPQNLTALDKASLAEILRRNEASPFRQRTITGYDLVFETGITSSLLTWLRPELIESVRSSTNRRDVHPELK